MNKQKQKMVICLLLCAVIILTGCASSSQKNGASAPKGNISSSEKVKSGDANSSRLPLELKDSAHNLYLGKIGEGKVLIDIYVNENKINLARVNQDDAETLFSGTLSDDSTITAKSADGKQSLELFSNELGIVSGTLESEGKKQNVMLKPDSTFFSQSFDMRYPNVGSNKAVESFVAKLKTAVSAGDIAGFASMVHYPISFSYQNKRLEVGSKEEFLKKVPSIPSSFKSAIKDSFGKFMFNNYQGVLFGSGTHNVWINAVDKKGQKVIEITGINF